MSKVNPYVNFGKELKRLRTEAKKTLTDLSGAVEYELDDLRSLESGETRPSEELIVLLINMFDLEDSDADKLWDLAGYSKSSKTDKAESDPLNMALGSLPIIVPMNDGRIVYTDTINVNANNYGLTLTFMQNSGKNGQPVAVSKVGMSLDHAVNFMKMMTDTVEKVVNDKKDSQVKKSDPKRKQD